MGSDLFLEIPADSQAGRRTLALPSSRATRSRGEEHFQRLRNFLPALDHISQYLKRDRLHLAHGFLFAGSVRHRTRKIRYGSQDSTILLPFQFYSNWLNLNHVTLIVANAPDRGLLRKLEEVDRLKRRNLPLLPALLDTALHRRPPLLALRALPVLLAPIGPLSLDSELPIQFHFAL